MRTKIPATAAEAYLLLRAAEDEVVQLRAELEKQRVRADEARKKALEEAIEAAENSGYEMCSCAAAIRALVDKEGA